MDKEVLHVYSEISLSQKKDSNAIYSCMDATRDYYTSEVSQKGRTNTVLPITYVESKYDRDEPIT